MILEEVQCLFHPTIMPQRSTAVYNLTMPQLTLWRKAIAEGTLGKTKRGSKANTDATDRIFHRVLDLFSPSSVKL